MLQLVIEHQLNSVRGVERLGPQLWATKNLSFQMDRENRSIVIFTSESKDVRAFKCFVQF